MDMLREEVGRRDVVRLARDSQPAGKRRAMGEKLPDASE
jgi:hypothetical protein